LVMTRSEVSTAARMAGPTSIMEAK
jgi:hypothetical protein